jgi:uncharacterized Zn finger protein
MKSLIESINENSLRKLATASDFRLGKEIFEAGGVEIIEMKQFQVIAKAQPPGGQKRTVVLTSTEDGLQCHCT